MKAIIKQCLWINFFFTGPCEAAVCLLTKECGIAGLVKSLHIADLGKEGSLYNECIFFKGFIVSSALLCRAFFFNPNHLN